MVSNYNSVFFNKMGNFIKMRKHAIETYPMPVTFENFALYTNSLTPTNDKRCIAKNPVNIMKQNSLRSFGSSSVHFFMGLTQIPMEKISLKRGKMHCSVI